MRGFIALTLIGVALIAVPAYAETPVSLDLRRDVFTAPATALALGGMPRLMSDNLAQELLMAPVTTSARSSASSLMLLPDLKQQPPSELTLSKKGGQVRLGFRSATENLGLGPLMINGRRADRRDTRMLATQVIRTTDGETVQRSPVGTLSYIRLNDHRHWHLADFMRYELRRARDFKRVRPGLKTGFCLGDRVNVDIFTRMPNEPDHAVYRSECGFHRPRILRVREGISVGNLDYYAANLEGQYMDITKLRAGRYWLVHRANPEHLILESDDTNNAASLLLSVERVPISRGRTRILVKTLRQCPDSARCTAPINQQGGSDG